MKVLITGASKGIGLFLLNELNSKGIDVYGIYNSTLPPDNLKSRYTKVDITDFEQTNSWVNGMAKENDEIVLINCAGTNYNSFAHKSDIEKWKQIIEINLIGTFNIIKAVLPYMREVNFGRIINFSSVVAQKGIHGTSSYAASKSALWGMSKSIAVENANKGITINNLNLGYFEIGMIKDVPEEMLSNIEKSIPMKKLGNPKNIINAVTFLIDSDYITGSSIEINGGLI